VSLLDESLIDADMIHGRRQVTDVYLLALAVKHGGRFVSFDESIAAGAVRGAAGRNLVILDPD
jgi:predicted nucleic acid-binding protein